MFTDEQTWTTTAGDKVTVTRYTTAGGTTTGISLRLHAGGPAYLFGNDTDAVDELGAALQQAAAVAKRGPK